ncbi:MAG: response regulator [Candidatus Synoicihabitans palmerolidicus]|nr:response regulator [Candidatus Synoicihabitans palmerolidicus]
MSWKIDYTGAQSFDTALAEIKQDPAPALVLLDNDLLGAPGGAQLHTIIEQQNIPTLLLLTPGLQNDASNKTSLHFIPINKPLKSSTLLRGVHSLFRNPDHPHEVPAPSTQRRILAEELPLDVLLVEDNAVNQKVALRFLDRLGYRADAVGNGLEAVDAVAARRFDLVLMDLQMPEMDGFEAAREIRRRFPAEHQPKIIAFTANVLQGDRDICLAAGMDDYITKPVKLHELSVVIRRQFTTKTEPSSLPN